MDVRVTVIGEYTSRTKTIIQDVDNILEAKDKFARSQGYDSYGDMWVAYDDEGNKPPYTFNVTKR